MGVIVSVFLLFLLIGALADIITSDQSRIKHLPKLVWIIIVILMPLVGSLLWFVLGHDYAQATDRGGFGDPRRRAQATPPPLAAAPSYRSEPLTRGKWTPAPLTTEQELAALEREIAEDRIRQLEADLQAKRDAKGIEE